MLDLLRSFSWREGCHHPWRTAAAVAAVMLGVALAFSVQLINTSALHEFDAAARSLSGRPDLSLRPITGRLDDTLFAEVAQHPLVAAATPVLDITTHARPSGGEPAAVSVPLRVLGVDALSIGSVAPDLLPVPAPATGERLDVFAPDALFLSPRAAASLAGRSVTLLVGARQQSLRVAGSTGGSGGDGSSGPALAVMDIAAAQDLFGEVGQLSRIDLRLHPGADASALAHDLRQLPGFANRVTLAKPDDAGERVDALSQAYRVNLTVLALVALFTGSFLVFSVLSLSVSRRAQPIALLGVLGLTPGQRLRLVLAESLILGAVGTLLGLALGTALAYGALALLGGDLGGGYFPGLAPRLHWSGSAALVYGGLGLLAAGVAGWWPARTAQRLPPAQTLKGLGWAQVGGRHRHWIGLLLMGVGALLSTAPPVAGLPLAAYASVGFILIGGIASLPGAVALLVGAVRPWSARRVLPLLAVERAHRQRESAAVAISGVVAALSLAVALTVMVSSFRASVTAWLDTLLPADLYLRTPGGSASAPQALLSPEFVAALGRVPEVQRVVAQRTLALQLDPARPSVALLARPLTNPSTALPLVDELAPAPSDERTLSAYVSEAFADLYGVRVGQVFTLAGLARGGAADADLPAGQAALPASAAALTQTPWVVRGIWRDYVRQHGSIAVDRADYLRLTQDRQSSEALLWLVDGAQTYAVQARIRALAEQQAPGLAPLLEFASAQQLRATSLRIFDRSFAVTYWLQAVAIGIGLFGVAASFSAQVLARRKEFGLLAHLGLTRRQTLQLVALEGLAWTLVGALAGLALGLVVARVLVDVVNPQSFHWTMDLAVPWPRLWLLCAALVASGTLTAWLAGRAAARHEAVLAVKEDW